MRVKGGVWYDIEVKGVPSTRFRVLTSSKSQMTFHCFGVPSDSVFNIDRDKTPLRVTVLSNARSVAGELELASPGAQPKVHISTKRVM